MEVVMKRLKHAAAPAAALLTLAITSTTLAAVNLPDISVTLTGGTYPLHLQGTLPKISWRLGTASGVVWEGTGVTLLLLTTDLSALGKFTFDFTNMEEPKTGAKCNTAGDASGVVLESGEFHLVPLEVSASLPIGILFLVSEFEIKCAGSYEPIFRGDLLSGLEGIGTETTELTSLATTLEGELGKQNVNSYFNDGGTKIEPKFEIEEGAGFVAADIDLVGQLGLSVLGSQMIRITNR
jgi:hypothetical protein